MRDTDLYQRILGLEKPWFVKRVDLQVAENRVDIWLEHPGGAKWPCPKCGQELPWFAPGGPGLRKKSAILAMAAELRRARKPSGPWSGGALALA